MNKNIMENPFIALIPITLRPDVVFVSGDGAWLSFDNGFHGHTLIAMTASGRPGWDQCSSRKRQSNLVYHRQPARQGRYTFQPGAYSRIRLQ